MWATNGMVLYDHATNTAQNVSDPLDPNAYTHGIVRHLGPFPGHKGLLLVLPSKIFGVGENFTEYGSGGKSVRYIGYFSPLKQLKLISMISSILPRSCSLTLKKKNFISKKQVFLRTKDHYQGQGSVQ